MISAINLDDAAADDTVLGHAFYGETIACSASVAASASHKQQLVRGKRGE